MFGIARLRLFGRFPSRVRGDRSRGDPWDELRRYAERHSEVMAGYYNRNYPVELPAPLAAEVGLCAGSVAKVRVPIQDAFAYDMRIWTREDHLLTAIGGLVGGIPHVLKRRDEFSVHTYARGEPMGRNEPSGTEVGDRRLAQIARLFSEIVSVPSAVLPPRPPMWPRNGDCTRFLHTLLAFTVDQVLEPNRRRFASVLGSLGVPSDPLARLSARVGELHPRPFVLIHGDLHRDNLIVGPGGGLSPIDWELAMFGDPLYDLATHLCRMEYPRPHQWAAAVEAWRASVSAVSPKLAEGLDRDLPLYLDYKRVQSVYTDTKRAADRVTVDGSPRAVADASAFVRNALLKAQRAISLTRIPTEREIGRALLAWPRDGGDPPAPVEAGTGAGRIAGRGGKPLLSRAGPGRSDAPFLKRR